MVSPRKCCPCGQGRKVEMPSQLPVSTVVVLQRPPLAGRLCVKPNGHNSERRPWEEAIVADAVGTLPRSPWHSLFLFARMGSQCRYLQQTLLWALSNCCCQLGPQGKEACSAKKLRTLEAVLSQGHVGVVG